jgi:hypothetical protein
MIQYDAINYSCKNQMIIQYDRILMRLATKYSDYKSNGSINSIYSTVLLARYSIRLRLKKNHF